MATKGVDVELDSDVSETPLMRLTVREVFIVYCLCEDSKLFITFSTSLCIKMSVMVKLYCWVRMPQYTAVALGTIIGCMCRSIYVSVHMWA
jgi:hypothetical protein